MKPQMAAIGVAGYALVSVVVVTATAAPQPPAAAAELSTEQPPADVAAAWTAAVVTSCETSGDARAADVARQTYDAGGYSPPQG